MSRRGNCWDNAPQESYFGHMKDELNLDTCFTFSDVCKEIKNYIEYLNPLPKLSLFYLVLDIG